MSYTMRGEKEIFHGKLNENKKTTAFYHFNPHPYRLDRIGRPRRYAVVVPHFDSPIGFMVHWNL